MRIFWFFLVNKNFFQCANLFFLVNEVDVKALFKALFYIWRRFLFRFIIIKFIVKKCYFVSKEVLFD